MIKELFKILVIILKLIFLLSFVTAENNYHRCGFASTDSQYRISRPSLDTFVDDGFFRIHYDLNGKDAPEQGYGEDIQLYEDTNGSGHPDYIDALGDAANYSYDVMVDLGYGPALLLIIEDCNNSSDCQDRGGSPLYDIYVNDRYAISEGYTVTEYGVNNSDGNDDIIKGSSFIEIDNGMTETSYFTNGLDAMRTTIAHELFHAVQRSYRDYDPGSGHAYFYEMSSTWIEDIVYPDINDYINSGWTEKFFNHPHMLSNIQDTNGYSIGLYMHYLTKKIAENDNQIIQDIWEKFEINNDPLASINDVLKEKNTNFIKTWIDFCSFNFFNGLYPDDNNDFYFHPDQILFAQPITIEDSDHDYPFTTNISSLIDIDNTSIDIISIRNVNPESDFNIDIQTNLENLDTPLSSIIGNIVLLSPNNLDSQKVIDINEFSSEMYDGIEYIYFILGLDDYEINNNQFNNYLHKTESTEFDVSFCNESKGDIDLNCIINILDYIILVENIVDSIDDNSIDRSPFPLCDLNDDNECNTTDAELLINLISETP